MTWEYPVEALKTDVESILTAAGTTTPHFIGERHLQTNRAAPYIIWLPTGSSALNAAAPTRDVDEDRTLALAREDFQIVIRGRTFAEVHALRNNVVKALHDSAFADVTIRGARWVRPGTGYNQDGEHLAIECSLEIPLIDAFVNLETLADPAPSLVTPTAIVGTVEVSEDVDTAGELGLIVTEN